MSRRAKSSKERLLVRSQSILLGTFYPPKKNHFTNFCLIHAICLTYAALLHYVLAVELWACCPWRGRAFLCHSLYFSHHSVLSAIPKKILTLAVLCKAAHSHVKKWGHSLSELMCSFIALFFSCNKGKRKMLEWAYTQNSLFNYSISPPKAPLNNTFLCCLLTKVDENISIKGTAFLLWVSAGLPFTFLSHMRSSQ